MANALDNAIAAVGGGAPQQPQLSAVDRAIMASQAMQPADVNPATGGTNLQIYNPFGSNVDTGIQLGDTVSRGLEGIGGALSDAWLGTKQRLHQATYDDAAEKRRLDAPLLATTAGKAGNVIGNTAIAAGGALAPGAGTYAGATALGAVLGAIQPSTSAGETAVNTGVGGAAGAAGQFVANRIAGLVNALRTGGGEALTPGQQAALQTADRLGFQTTPAARSGSRPLSQVEAKLESQPESSGPFNAVRANNDRALGRVAARSIGEDADNVSSEVMGRAYARLGNVFDSVADRTPVPLDPQQFGPRIQQVLHDSEGMIGNNGSLADNGLFRRLDNFVNTNGGATREQLRDLSSKLGKAARNNLTSANGDRELGLSLSHLQDIVEDGIQGTLSGAQQAEYQAARDQYRNLMNLTARNSIVNPSSGNVNGRALANVLMSKDKGGFTFGRNDSDLYNAARFVQAFPSLVGDSGTATRIPMSIGQIPSRVAGALGSRWYMGVGDMLTGQAPRSVPGAVWNAAMADPMAQEFARLLTMPQAQRALPALSAQGALYGRALINSAQQ